jgi:hypothetical protein
MRIFASISSHASTLVEINGPHIRLTFVWGHISTGDYHAGRQLADTSSENLDKLSAQVQALLVGGDELGFNAEPRRR